MDLGILLLRLLLAALLLGHSTQKLLGWFGGAGIGGTAPVFETWGFTPARRMVALAGASELLGAGSIGLGLLTPAGCAAVVGTMTVAAVATSPQGFWAQKGGCEVPFCYGALAAILGFTGPGRWSLDRAFGLTGWSGAGWGVAVLAVGLAAAGVPVAGRARVLRGRRESRAGG